MRERRYPMLSFWSIESTARHGLLLLALAAYVAPMRAAEPTPETGRRPGTPPASVDQLFEHLNADEFDTRATAAAALEALAVRPEWRDALADRTQRALIDPGTPFEARTVLESLAARLPKTPRFELVRASDDELARLIDQLDADDYGARVGARYRLSALLAESGYAIKILTFVKRALAAPSVASDRRRRLETIANEARDVWLVSSDDGSWVKTSGEQLGLWLDDLSRAESDPRTAADDDRRRLAERELLDAMACDAMLPQVKQMLEQRLQDRDLPVVARLRLESLFDWTRPAMVAEIWRGHEHSVIQNLLVGVPCQAVGAERPTHFDRCTDQVAHCVSGNALSPGDYPVGVFFPPPRGRPQYSNVQFHLVNLPTPRRRMAYERRLTRPESERLAETSRATLARFLAAKRALSPGEIDMLAWLDPVEVSRFAGPFLMAVDDQIPTEPDPDSVEPLSSDGASLHGRLCGVLLLVGTPEALPGLVRAIDQKRILPARSAKGESTALPYSVEWLAGLAIATRNPTLPEVDAWLVELVARRTPIQLDAEQPAEVGATAAAMLLTRHGEVPQSYGLAVVWDEPLQFLGIGGCRWAAADRSAEVVAWWKARPASAAPRLP